MSTKPLASQVRYVEPLGAETTVQAKLNTISKQSDRAILSFPSLASAEAAAASLPDGQVVEAPDADGRLSEFDVNGGMLAFVDFIPDARTLASITELRSLRAPRGRCVAHVLGYHAPGDCEPWSLVWVPASTKLHNGGSVIMPIGHLGNGRWECGGDVAADPDHWGALGPDGKLNFVRMNAAIANAPDKYLRLRRTYTTASTTEQISIGIDKFELRGANRDIAGIQQDATTTQIGVPLINVTGNSVAIMGLDLGGGRPFDATEESNLTQGRNQLIFSQTVTKGVSVMNCRLHDCYRRGGTFSGDAPVLMHNIVERCGLYGTDTGPMDAGFRMDDSKNALIHYNTLRKCGQWGIAAPRADGIDVGFNIIDSPSMIGVGMNNALMPKVHNNQVSNTFNSGIDLQQCRGQAVYGNTLKYCGFGDFNYETAAIDRVYQAIYVGDDTPRSSTDLSNCVGGAVFANSIIGGWAKGAAVPGSKQQTGCGIAMVAAQDMTVFGNTITGIGVMSLYDTVVQGNKDGCGIKATNRCVGLRIHDNNITQCKLDGITLGRGIIEFVSVYDNEIDKYARFGISALGVLGMESLEIDDNRIGEAESARTEPIRSSIYIGVGSGAVADGLYVRRNDMRRRRNDSVTNNTHRIYFDVMDGGTAWTIGVHEICDNNMRDANTAAMYSRIQPAVIGKVRHACRVHNNRAGKYDAGAVISTFEGMWDTAVEFTTNAVPTTGYYGQGSRAWNGFPSYGGQIGWACVASGVPGVWRTFGQIAA